MAGSLVWHSCPSDKKNSNNRLLCNNSDDCDYAISTGEFLFKHIINLLAQRGLSRWRKCSFGRGALLSSSGSKNDFMQTSFIPTNRIPNNQSTQTFSNQSIIGKREQLQLIKFNWGTRMLMCSKLFQNAETPLVVLGLPKIVAASVVRVMLS